MENTQVVSFAEAMIAVKEGKRVQRVGWNGRGLFVFKQVPAEIDKDIVPFMQSLPQAVKDEFIRRFEDDSQQIDAIYYNNQMCIVNSSNLIDSWSPSVSDSLNDDWVILD